MSTFWSIFTWVAVLVTLGIIWSAVRGPSRKGQMLKRECGKECEDLRVYHKFIWAQYLSQQRELRLLNRAIVRKNKTIKRLREARKD